MSELRSVVDRLRSESLAELPDARIEEDFTALQGAIEPPAAVRARRSPVGGVVARVAVPGGVGLGAG
jgi:hypothetical protein